MDREFYSGIFFYEEIMGKRNMRVFDIYSFNVAKNDHNNSIDTQLHIGGVLHPSVIHKQRVPDAEVFQ